MKKYKMNIEKITFRVIKDSLESKTGRESAKFILKMMISYLTDEQRGVIMDEIVDEKKHILFEKGDEIWFDPKDNKYDLKECYEDDIMKDALLMTKQGYIKGIIIDDNNYQDTCSPYATEYKVQVQFAIVRTGATLEMDTKKANKQVRVKRSNIIRIGTL